MILRTLKSNRSINLALFPIIGVLFWLRNILFPTEYPFYVAENETPLFAPIYKLLEGYGLVQVLIAFALVVFIAFFIQQINDRYALIRTRTKLPAIVFVIIVGGFTTLHTLHPVYFAAIFLLLAVYNLFAVFNNPAPFPPIFNAGLFLSIGVLFYFKLIVIFPALLIGVIILYREVSWHELLICVVGFFVPLIFAAGITFYDDSFLEFLKTMEQNFVTPVNHIKNNYPLYGFLLFLTIFIVTASLRFLQQFDTRKVSTRKYYSIFLIIFSFAMAGLMLVPATSQEMLIISAVPVTFLISNLLVSMESRFWGELLFILLIVASAFMQFGEDLF